MGLIDINGKPLERGIYTIPGFSDGGTPVVLFFQQDEKGEWVSKSPHGDVSILVSGIEGKGVYSCAFSRVPNYEVKMYIKDLEYHISLANFKISLLEEFVKEQPTEK